MFVLSGGGRKAGVPEGPTSAAVIREQTLQDPAGRRGHPPHQVGLVRGLAAAARPRNQPKVTVICCQGRSGHEQARYGSVHVPA